MAKKDDKQLVQKIITETKKLKQALAKNPKTNFYDHQKDADRYL